MMINRSFRCISMTLFLVILTTSKVGNLDANLGNSSNHLS